MTCLPVSNSPLLKTSELDIFFSTFSLGMCVHVGRNENWFLHQIFQSVPLLIQRGGKGTHVLNSLHLICILVKFRLFITTATHVCVCILLLYATRSQLKHNYLGVPLRLSLGIACVQSLLPIVLHLVEQAQNHVTFFRLLMYTCRFVQDFFLGGRNVDACVNALTRVL